MPVHPPARRQRRARSRRQACSARTRRPASRSRCKTGRFGPYVQLGEAAKDGEKPKRAGIPKGMGARRRSTSRRALKLLSLPREVGKHPESGEPIMAGIGRFGPYVQHGKTYANLEAGDDVLTIGLNRAVTLIAEKIANPGKGAASAPIPAARSATTRQSGGAIVVKKGRYGPYVSHNGINATMPDDKNPDEITLEEAVALIEARADKTGAKPAPRRKAPRKTTPRPRSHAGGRRRRKPKNGRQAPKSEGRRQADDEGRRQAAKTAR